MDERQWRIAVHPSGPPDGPEAPGLRYLGLELPSPDAVAKAADALSQRDVELRPGTPEESQARDVDALVVLHDPAGHRLELFSGPLQDGGFQSPHAAEFKIGGLGMGHAVLFVADLDAALNFYVETLGFQRSDYALFGPDSSIHFLRCTERHHSIALLKVGPPCGLQHLMLEMRNVDQVGQALDRAMAQQIPIQSGLGRHRNDLTFSFYMQGPSGFDVEIGCESLLVGDDWVEHEFAGNGDLWGHQGLTAESLKPPDS
jgi:3,4-dihydroxy-9,10-secoandrosta-1,3,5(10)-triene-9,17-dione 4,5-dioxygenase